MFLVSRLLPVTAATLNPIANVNSAEIAPKTTNSDEHNCGDVVNVNNNGKPSNKQAAALKNLTQSKVKDSNFDESGWIILALHLWKLLHRLQDVIILIFSLNTINSSLQLNYWFGVFQST